jgi:uncharacterized protein YodC (DUF2158 family)
MKVKSQFIMKKVIINLSVITIFFLSFNACKKSSNSVPVLLNITGYGVKPNEVTLGSTVASNGGSSVTERGICYGTASNPTIDNNKVIDGSNSTAGGFQVTIKGLNANTKYYFRSYAKNANGVGYGSELDITTPAYNLSAFVGNAAFAATSFTSSVSGSRLYLIGSKGSETITLYMPANNLVTGTFTMQKFGNYEATYSNGTTYTIKSGTGSMTINEVSSSGKVKGIFNFVGEDPSNTSAATKNITAGNFEVYK